MVQLCYWRTRTWKRERRWQNWSGFESLTAPLRDWCDPYSSVPLSTYCPPKILVPANIVCCSPGGAPTRPPPAGWEASFLIFPKDPFFPSYNQNYLRYIKTCRPYFWPNQQINLQYFECTVLLLYIQYDIQLQTISLSCCITVNSCNSDLTEKQWFNSLSGVLPHFLTLLITISAKMKVYRKSTGIIHGINY